MLVNGDSRVSVVSFGHLGLMSRFNDSKSKTDARYMKAAGTTLNC